MKKVYHHLQPRPNPKLLSLVIPTYNEEEVLPKLRSRIIDLLEKLPCEAEVILVNDGSTDHTLESLLDWSRNDPRVQVVSLARNFGHQNALTAGLDTAGGEAVVIMDADLQDPPELVLNMLEEYRKGYDVAYGQRIRRQGEGIMKRLTAWMFYRIMQWFVLRDLPADASEFRLISRPCLEALRSMRETHRILRGMVAWVGFAQIGVPFEKPPRAAGETHYTWRKMIALSWTAAMSFSPAPLRMILLLGLIISVLGVMYGLYAAIRVFSGLYVVPGWTSSIVVTSVVGGAILVSIGVLGEYVAKVFEELKDRPLYVVSLRTPARREQEPALELESDAREKATQGAPP